MSEIAEPLDVVKAAAYLGFTKAYLYKLVHMGKIACFKPTGGKRFFKKSDLEAFIFRGRKSADYELAEQAGNILNSRAN